MHFSAITRPLQLFNAFNYICWPALNVFIINRINIDTGAPPLPPPITRSDPLHSHPSIAIAMMIPIAPQLWLIVD